MRRLNLGPTVVGALLPHKPPFRLVDRVVRFDAEAGIEAEKLISTNEPVFTGHFPDMPLWPGVYTIEALAQCANLLLVIEGMAEAHPGGLDGVLADLDTLARASRFEPVRGELPDLEALRGPERIGLLVAVDVKLTAPAFAGDTLRLGARKTAGHGGMIQLAVDATVEGRTVGKGRITVAVRER